MTVPHLLRPHLRGYLLLEVGGLQCPTLQVALQGCSIPACCWTREVMGDTGHHWTVCTHKSIACTHTHTHKCEVRSSGPLAFGFPAYSKSVSLSRLHSYALYIRVRSESETLKGTTLRGSRPPWLPQSLVYYISIPSCVLCFPSRQLRQSLRLGVFPTARSESLSCKDAIREQ